MLSQRVSDELFTVIFKNPYASHVRRPPLEYGDPVLFSSMVTKMDKIKQIQCYAVQLLGGPSEIDYEVRLRLLYPFPMRYRRLCDALAYSWKILRGDMGREFWAQFFTCCSRHGYHLKLLELNSTNVASVHHVHESDFNWSSLSARVVEEDREGGFERRLDGDIREFGKTLPEAYARRAPFAPHFRWSWRWR